MARFCPGLLVEVVFYLARDGPVSFFRIWLDGVGLYLRVLETLHATGSRDPACGGLMCFSSSLSVIRESPLR